MTHEFHLFNIRGICYSRRLKANLSYESGEPTEIHDTHGTWLAGWLAGIEMDGYGA